MRSTLQLSTTCLSLFAFFAMTTASANAATTWSAGTLNIDTDAGTIFFNGADQSALFTTSTTPIAGGFEQRNFDFSDSLTIGQSIASVAVNVTGTRSLQINVTGDLKVNSSIDISGANGANAAVGPVGAVGGFAGGSRNVPTTAVTNGPGAGSYLPAAAFSAGPGAGYGGAGGANGFCCGGGAGTPGGAYGDAAISSLIGGSGGSGSIDGGPGFQFSTGGAGGGAIGLSATGTLAVNGSISASGGNGGNGNTGGGGGSGGSVRLSATTFEGTGQIRANGGAGNAGTALGGGGGGGGRISVSATTDAFTGVAEVNGGAGGVGTTSSGAPGSAGTGASAGNYRISQNGAFIDEDLQGNVNGWSGWGGGTAGFLPAAGDIDDAGVTNLTTVPNALNLVNGVAPFANAPTVQTKTYDFEIAPGIYEFLIQVVDFNNADFPPPAFDFNGLTPDSFTMSNTGVLDGFTGDDGIWRYTYRVHDGDPVIGQQVALSFVSTTPVGGNYGVDHIYATFTIPAPEPSTFGLCALGIVGLGLFRRRSSMARRHN